MEVAHPVIPIEDLRESFLEDVEVLHLSREMERNIGEALRISLSKVQARYFRDSDIGDQLVEERNYGDVIENHYQFGRYKIEDIDGVLFPIDMPQAPYPHVNQSRPKVSDTYRSSYRKADDLMHIQS
jgi:hypothetical protein